MNSLKLQWTWLIDLASNFRRHLLIISIVIFSIGILSTQILLILTSLITLIFSAVPLTSWQKKRNSPSTDNSRQLVVTSFNIQWNADNHVRSLMYIEQCQADVIVLQEVTLETSIIINNFRDRFPYQYGEGHSHVMVISRYKLQFIEYIKWPGKFAKRALHVTCSIHGRLIHLFAVHLQVTRIWHEVAIRNQQIASLSNSIKNCNDAVMVVGDFNAAPGSRVLNTIEKEIGLKISSTLLSYRPTWPAKAGILGIQLDHFFVSSNLHVLSQQPGPCLDSDHRPITATVYIRNK